MPQDDSLAGDADTESIADTEEPGPSRNREHKGSTWTNPAEYLRSMEAMMNRLLDEHGFMKGGLSPTPRKQRATRQKEDQSLEDEKNDANRSKHLVGYLRIFIDHALITSQEHLQNLFKSVYGIECDEDFGGYSSVTVKQVKDFEGGGAGPSDDYPRWDMRGMKTSAWNDAVIGILMENLLAKLEESPQFPPKSREYWENAIGEKFTCIKAVWTKAQPQMTDAGKVEDPDEVEEHRIKDAEKRLKRIRVWERRANVRHPFY